MLERRTPLAHLPTPLLGADRLGRELGLAPGRLFVKHDDVTGLAGGGNKVRKLEYLCADAVEQGCDTLITGGGRQSNHVRLTAAAANRLGLTAVLVMASDRPAVPSGNVVMDELLGAEMVWAGVLEYDDLDARIAAEVNERVGRGARAYHVPIGGATAVGALGYVRAADELRSQLADAGADLGLVVVADGSGGTHAGLVAGLGDAGLVLGVNVGTRPDLDVKVPAKAAEAAALAGRSAPTGDYSIDHDRYGTGYAEATDEGLAAMRLAARTEGMVLEPVYTGKAMAGLVAAAREGRLPTEGAIVFLHTGGLPALFAGRYATWIRDGAS